MAYKDADKQKEAQRQWVRQKRAKQGSTSEGSTKGITHKARTVTPEQLEDVADFLEVLAKQGQGLTVEDVVAYRKGLITAAEAQAILDRWEGQLKQVGHSRPPARSQAG